MSYLVSYGLSLSMDDQESRPKGAAGPGQYSGAFRAAFYQHVSREHGNYRASLILSLCLIFLCSSQLQAKNTSRVYFKGTDAELEVHFINGEVSGSTLLLLGGIQGDEPGGYLAADLYADISLKKGNIIVVPRANFPSIVGNSRGVAGDMNRKFAGRIMASDRDAAVVGVIKELMNESDFFLNLHDGSGFFSPVWESTLRNPMRFGQSIIADAEEHTALMVLCSTWRAWLNRCSRRSMPKFLSRNIDSGSTTTGRWKKAPFTRSSDCPRRFTL